MVHLEPFRGWEPARGRSEFEVYSGKNWKGLTIQMSSEGKGVYGTKTKVS